MPKGILKKDGNRRIKSIAWDEIAIAEHDLTRGERMKINEPKTPFIHYSLESDIVMGTSGKNIILNLKLIYHQ